MPTFKIGFLTITIIDLIDIVLVTWIFYKVYQYFRETRAGQMLIGLIILLISSFIFNSLDLSSHVLVVKPISNCLGCCFCDFISA